MTTSAPPRSNGISAPGSRVAVSFNVTDEVDRYTKSIAGVQIEAYRNGPGGDANSVLTLSEPGFTMTSSDVRLPLLSRTTVGDDKIVMTYVRSATPGSRWCGFDLEPGSLIVYGPSAEHAAVTQPGLCWTCAITDLDHLAAVADRLERPINLPPSGAVWSVPRTPGYRAVGDTLSALTQAALDPVGPLDGASDYALHAMVMALSKSDEGHRVSGGRGIDSHQITRLSIDYANSLGRVPSLGELCIAAHVSERRLRKAFIDLYEVPPARFFRTWALAEARRQLLDEDPTHHSVANVAAGLGFFHLGRFAGYYSGIYDEPPSTTLRVG